jgi:hypothetical protein
MRQIAPLEDKRVLSPADMALALKLVGETDLLRLKTIARLHSRGLPPDLSWEDLIQEAFARVLTGARRQPEGVTTIAEHWRRFSRGPEYGRTDHDVEPWDPAPDPEHSLNALQQQELIDASDEEIMAAAADLGMNPAMKGSAAFAGLKYPANPRFSDFFYDIDAWHGAQTEEERIARETRRLKSKPPS